MGKKYVIDESTLTDIADVIRDYGRPENAEKKYKPTDMRDGIVGVSDRAGTEGYDAGYIVGLDKGGEEGYKAGYTEGEVAGKQTAYDDFWDTFQQNGARTNYIYGFGGYGWNDTTFKPKYNIVPTGSASGLFYDVRIKNLEDLLLKAGVTLDTSNCTGMVNAFRDSSVTVVPTINTAKFDSGNLQNTFRNCLSLVTIRKLILRTDGKQIYTSTFDECSNLQNIVVEGVIGRTVTFRWSPLSVGSLKSIISCLKDYTGGSEHSYTVTFKASAFAVLEAEGATAEYNGTPCTWAELIDNKKWNLTLA